MPRYLCFLTALWALVLAPGCQQQSITEEPVPLREQHRIAVRAGNLSRARDLERRILAVRTSLETFVGLRQAYAAAGRYDEARRVMRAALAALPPLAEGEEARVRRLLASDSYAQGSHESALAEFEVALRLAPEDPEVLNDFAYFLADTRRDVPRALEMARKAVAARPRRPETRDTLGWALFRAGDLPGARRELQIALGLDAACPDILLHLAAVEEELGNRPAAVEHLVRCIEVAPPRSSQRQEAKRRLRVVDPKAYNAATSVMRREGP